MALGSTEMSTRDLPRGKGQLACEADNFTAVCEPVVSKIWVLRHLTTLWASTICYRGRFNFFFTPIKLGAFIHVKIFSVCDPCSFKSGKYGNRDHQISHIKMFVIIRIFV
jgi:hypothetical protein